MARTAGSTAVLAGLGVMAALHQACDPEPSTTTEAPYAEVLAQVGPGVVVPALEAFLVDARALEQATADWSSDPGAKETAQQAWETAMLSWQRVDPMQLGPLASSAEPAGQDLRDAVYSWPTVNPCLVDQNTVNGGFDDPAWYEANLVNAYGMDALHILLFSGPDNACPGQVPINSEGSWAALGEQGVDAARATYAAALAARVVADAERALEAWRGFTPDATVYGDDMAALDAVFGALYVAETSVADRKLAEPFFQRECVEGCLDMLETDHPDNARWIAANLRGLQAMYTGGDGPGLDDLLVAQGDDGLAAEIAASFETCIAAFESVPMSLNELYTSDQAAALALLTEVRALTDLLEEQMAPALTLRIPESAGGDLD